MNSFCIDNLPNNYYINTQRRSDFKKKSFFYRMTHPVEKLSVDYELYVEVLTYLDRNFQINDLEQTARIWDFVLKSHKIRWEKEDNLSTKKFKRIYQAFKKSIVYTGPGINCPFDGKEIVDGLANFFLGKEGKIPKAFLNWKNLKKIILSLDRSLVDKFRGKLQEALIYGLNAFQLGTIDENIFKGFVFNIIGLLPYTYPEEGTTMHIPAKINGRWEMALYRFDKKFKMSPSWFSSPLPVYGLVSDNAPSILACLGTTYPAGEGFIASILSDFTPCFSVGHGASLYGKKEIQKWLDGKNNVRIAGISLGGSIAFQLSRQHSLSISEVYAFNPAGLYPWNWKSTNHKDINYHIYSNDNDLVSTMGTFPNGKNVKVYRILSQTCENFLAAHNRMYYASERISMIHTPVKYENRRPERIALTILHILFGCLVFFVVLPIHLIYKLCEFFYLQISQLCYNDLPEKAQDNHAQSFRSSAECTQSRNSKSSDKPKS